MLDRPFEALAVGESAVFEGPTLADAHLVSFAGLSGDHHPLHMSEEWAREGPYGARVAHGLLTVLLSNAAIKTASSGVNALLGLDRVRFLGPVFIGDAISLQATVSRRRVKGSQGIVTFAHRTFANERLVLRGEVTVRMSRDA